MDEPLHDYISIDTDTLVKSGKYSQDIQLDDGTYTFTFKWNPIDRTFTVDISDENGLIYAGEPLRLYVPLWRDCSDPRLPSERLVPMTNNFDKWITPANLNKSVFLCVDDLPESDDSNGSTIA